MPKWKELPTDPAALHTLYARLRDKEMKLEADLAIKEHPEVEEAITRVALALAEVKKLDENIQKSEKPRDLAERKQVEALVNRANHLRRQLEDAETQIRNIGGKAAEKLSEIKMNRDRSFAQLCQVFEYSKGVLNNFDLNLSVLVPSITDFIVVKPSQN